MRFNQSGNRMPDVGRDVFLPNQLVPAVFSGGNCKVTAQRAINFAGITFFYFGYLDVKFV
jgi:hypothetical protein